MRFVCAFVLKSTRPDLVQHHCIMLYNYILKLPTSFILVYYTMVSCIPDGAAA